MTPLRQTMIDAMQQRGFAVRTQQTYLAAVKDLARYFHRSPDQLTPDEIHAYFRYLALERHLSGASCRLYLNAIHFLYLQVLHWSEFPVDIVIPKRAQRIPELLSRKEVAQIIRACANPKHTMLLTLCYGCGLRVSEVVEIKVKQIDGERALLHVAQGKGGKDRVVIIAPSLLKQLREYWQQFRTPIWLFPHAQNYQRHISISAAQRIFCKAKQLSGVEKTGGIHSLRHAYATHQLEQGLPIHQLQKLLGHGNVRSTMRYLHWVPNAQNDNHYADLVARLEVKHD